MDIDGTEWRVLPGLIQAGHFNTVMQFAIEIHANLIKDLLHNDHVILH